MTDDTKITIRNFSVASVLILIGAVSASMAFAGRTEYRLAQLESSVGDRLAAYDSIQSEKLKRIELMLERMQKDSDALRAEVRQLYQLALSAKDVK